MSFEPFQYQGQKKKAAEPAASAPVPNGAAAPVAVSGAVARYQEPTFVSRVNPKEADSVHRTHKGHFHLDNAVSGQLGIEDREREEREVFLEKELARRWEKMSEQAEAAGYRKGLEEGKAEAYKAELPRINERMGKFDVILNELDLEDSRYGTYYKYYSYGKETVRGAEAHLDTAYGRDDAVRSGDAEALRREEGGGSHRHRSEADEAVKGGDELRHIRHGDAPGGNDADDCANGDGGEDG